MPCVRICLVGSFSKANISLKGKVRSLRPRSKKWPYSFEHLIWTLAWLQLLLRFCKLLLVTQQCRWFIYNVLNLSFHLIPVKTALISKSLFLNRLTCQHSNLNSSFPPFRKNLAKPPVIDTSSTGSQHCLVSQAMLFLFSCSVISDFLWPHELQHTRLLCPLLSPRVCLNLRPLNQWCHPTASSSVVPFSFCLQSFQHQGLSQWVSSSHQVAKVLEFQLQHQSFQWTPRTDLL